MRLFEIPGGIPDALPIRAFGVDVDRYCWEDWHRDTRAKYPVRYFFGWTVRNWWSNRVAAPVVRLLRARWLKFWWQRRTRGWDDSETWNLDAEIARFALPRLRRFRELPRGYWHDPEAGDDDVLYHKQYTEHVLDEIEWFLSIHASEDGTWQLESKEDQDRYDRACDIFGRNFGHLWS